MSTLSGGAALTIRLEDANGKAPAPAGGPAAPASPPGAPDRGALDDVLQAVRDALHESAAATQDLLDDLQQSRPGRPRRAGADDEPFDPTAEARKRIEREAKAKQIESEYDRLRGGATGRAAERLEAERLHIEEEEAYARLTGGPPPGTPTTNYRPGAAPPPVPGGPGQPGSPNVPGYAPDWAERMTALGKSVGIVATALSTLAHVTNLATARFVALSQAQASAIVDKDLVTKEAQTTRANTTFVAGLITTVGVVAGAAITAGLAATGVGIPAAIATGAATAGLAAAGGLAVGAAGSAHAAGREDFVRQGKALEQDAQRLGKYSGPLANEQGLARARRIGSEVSEAEFLGPQLAELTRERAELERLQRARQAVDEQGQIKEQLEATRKEIAKQRAELAKQLGTLNETAKRQVEGIVKGKGGPLKKLIDQVGMPPPFDGRAVAGDELKKLRDQQLLKPAFGGL